MTSSARRQLFRRSKAGCWNCRSKKKKCDELRPHCTRCIRAGEGCRYPDAAASPDSMTSAIGAEYPSPSLSASTSYTNGPLLQPVLPMSRLPSSSSSRSFSQQQHKPYNHSAPQQPQLHSSQPPPPSSNAMMDWDDASARHPPYKRTRYDDMSSSASSTSSNAVYPDLFARPSQQARFDPHERFASSSSYESKGKSRDTLPPIAPFPPPSVPMTHSNSLPPLSSKRNNSGPALTDLSSSPNFSAYSANTSPQSNLGLPTFAGSVTQTNATTVASASISPDSHLAMSAPYQAPPSWKMPEAAHASGEAATVGLFGSSAEADASDKLVFDYTSSDPDPHELLQSLDFVSATTVTQVTKGSKAYFDFLHRVARLPQGQAMAHALAAMTATHQSNITRVIMSDGEAPDASRASPSTSPNFANSLRQHQKQQAPQQRLLRDSLGSSTPAVNPTSSQRSAMLDLADRHHLAAIKALQNQPQPSRRRRFSIIDTSSHAGAELPVGSNAGVMLLLILACNLAGKSLMLPSYFNQCEQFLSDAVEHMSSHRLFPSATGEALEGSPENPPPEDHKNRPNTVTLLSVATFIGIYEVYLAQYVAVTDWDYNPSRIKRLRPHNWTDLDAAVFDNTRCSVAETTYSVSMLTFELVIETLDTVRKFKRAEKAAYGQRQSSRSEAEDSKAALNSLALREELGLLLKDLEAGTFWKGAIRTLTHEEEEEVIKYLDVLSSDSPVSDVSKKAENTVKVDGDASADADATLPSARLLDGQETAPSSSMRHHITPSSTTSPRLSTADAGRTSSEGEPATNTMQSGSLFIPSSSGTGKKVNRVRLGNHLFRNALIIDLYLSVFNMSPNTSAVRDLVSRSIRLLEAVPELLELGLMWPVLVLGSNAQRGEERKKIETFLKRSQWKGSAGPNTAQRVLERLWTGESETWREAVTYFGSPLIT